VAKYKALKLAELAETKAEAWKEWERSKEPIVKTVVEAPNPGEECPVCGGEGTGSKPGTICFRCKGDGVIGKTPGSTTVTTEEQLGDPRYLAIIAKCIEDELQLEGLPPQRKKVSGNITPDGKGGLNWEMLVQEVTDAETGIVPDVVEGIIASVEQQTQKLPYGLKQLPASNGHSLQEYRPPRPPANEDPKDG
jgi:hypothetical protein